MYIGKCHTQRVHDPSIDVYSHANTGALIQYNSPNKSNCILGVYLNPLGDFTKQLQVLREKSDGMANLLRSSRITANNMRTFLQTIYTPAMLYVLPAVATDEENLATV
jgi:hypothetical protein